MCLTNIFFIVMSKNVLKSFKNIDKQNLLVKQCLSWLPNAQACLTSKIGNVCQVVLVRLAGALKEKQLRCLGTVEAEI